MFSGEPSLPENAETGGAVVESSDTVTSDTQNPNVIQRLALTFIPGPSASSVSTSWEPDITVDIPQTMPFK